MEELELENNSFDLSDLPEDLQRFVSDYMTNNNNSNNNNSNNSNNNGSVNKYDPVNKKYNNLNLNNKTKINRSNGQNECAICLSELSDTSNDKIVYLHECKHRFHKSCMNEMVRRRISRCPACRAEYSSYYGIIKEPNSIARRVKKKKN